ncbi:MAG TPA: hypothetical protein VKS60_25250 [Stellaceae bacterium]|nr:hypothetical protein [Stellaceae bacterium]
MQQKQSRRFGRDAATKATIMFVALLVAGADVCIAREVATPYSILEINIGNELVKVSINDDFEPISHPPDASPPAERHEAMVNITCDTMCGKGYHELVSGCSFGTFQFLPGSHDIITTWVPDCIQPFRVIIYNVSPAGVRKVLDDASGVPPQFVLGKTEHADVLTFAGTSGNYMKGTGHFKRWVWDQDKYALAAE